jgi:amidohydrolase
MSTTALKARAREAIARQSSHLISLSHRIHAHPEIGWEEFQASEWVAELASASGFTVDRGVCGLPTACRAAFGSGALRIGVCAEYDSLPGIGHACGHNIIAASGVGAALGLSAVADEINATVVLLGTPAEEVGNAGGKIKLLDGGAFDGLHAAMMVHPAPLDVAMPRLIAAATFEVHYAGKAAHASSFPELGVNAADALTVAQTSIGLLRQHMAPTERVHGIVTHGGDAPNIVPDRTSALFTIRAASLDELEALRPRVYACFEAGALATGARLSIRGGDQPYAEVVHDPDLARLYRQNAESLGRVFTDTGPVIERSAASTDMGNVSRRIPSLHPLIGINSFPAVNHQPEFAAHCVTAAGDRAVLDGAIAMAWTAIDAAIAPDVRARLLAPSGRLA